jgi:3-oxoacyl-[acyl-carrier protein] reductase
MVDDFASLTGDRNAVHVDEEIARRFRYRKRVVHGMLPVSFLVCLEEAFPDAALTLSSMDVRFVSPVFPDVPLRLNAVVEPAPEGLMVFTARWTREADGMSLIEASGTFRVEQAPLPVFRAPDSEGCLLTEPISEATYVIDELEGRTATLGFCLDPAVLSRFQTMLFRTALGREDYAFCPNLAATLLLSTLVGMRLPGRNATFASFTVSFEGSVPHGAPCSLSAAVEKVSKGSDLLNLSASFLGDSETFGSARLKVLVNPRPRAMIDCETIKERYLEAGVRGKVVVITGSSRGIGETAAKLFAMHGARTVVHFHRGRRDAEAIMEEIRQAGGTALALGCDIREERDVARFFRDIVDAYGQVDILINNAVQDFRPCGVLKLRWEDYLEELEVSLKGMHNCCREAVPIFRRQGGGKIVNVSSVAVDNPVTGQNKYITAKSAVVGYSRSLAKELVQHNIQVNVVVPAMTETDLLSSLPPELVTRIAEEREYRRHLAPIEVALCMLYLSSGWSDGITGQRVVLNLGEPPFA